MGGQQPPAPTGALQQVAVTAEVKANAKHSINRVLLLLVPDKVAHVSEKVITQLKPLSEFAVEDFFPLVPAGATPLAMPADVNFTTFVAAFMETLEYGMGGAQAVCKGNVSHLRGELEAVQKSVEVYLLRHFSQLSWHSAKVRKLLLKAMNGGLKDAMTALATQGGGDLPETPVRPPPAGTGVAMLMPTFTRLRELVEEGAAASLRVRKDVWRQPSDKAADSVGGKRKGAPGAGGQGMTPTQSRVGGGGLPASFKAHMQDRSTPPGVCDYAWRGIPCPLVNCLFAHQVPTQQQPQPQPPQALPPPSLPPPPPPRQPQPQQTAAAGGKTGSGGEGGGQRRPSVARYSRNFTGGGRGGARGGGRSGTGLWQQLTVRALPSGRADRRGSKGAGTMDSIRKRHEVRGIPPCTHSRVRVASPVSR